MVVLVQVHPVEFVQLELVVRDVEVHYVFFISAKVPLVEIAAVDKVLMQRDVISIRFRVYHFDLRFAKSDTSSFLPSLKIGNRHIFVVHIVVANLREVVSKRLFEDPLVKSCNLVVVEIKRFPGAAKLRQIVFPFLKDDLVDRVVVARAGSNGEDVGQLAAILPVGVRYKVIVARSVNLKPLDHKSTVHALSSELLGRNVVVAVGVEHGPHVLVDHKADPLNPRDLIVAVLVVPGGQGRVGNVGFEFGLGNGVGSVVILDSKEEVLGDAASLPLSEAHFTVVVSVEELPLESRFANRQGALKLENCVTLGRDIPVALSGDKGGKLDESN